MPLSKMLGGIPIRETTAAGLIRYLDRRASAAPLAIGFANHNFVVTCRDCCDSVANARGILLVNDGVGVQIATRLIHGRGFRENMNGTDFVPRFLRQARGDLTVFLVGGTPEVVEKAAHLIDAMPRRRVVGFVDGFSLWAQEAEIIARINGLRPDVLLVGLGNPKQERWILSHRQSLNVRMIFAVGALYQWMTGSRRRAPAFVRRARAEWLYRLLLEPRRLAKRYTYDVAVFFWLVWRHRKSAS